MPGASDRISVYGLPSDSERTLYEHVPFLTATVTGATERTFTADLQMGTDSPSTDQYHIFLTPQTISIFAHPASYPTGTGGAGGGVKLTSI
jgi:hypothetical protein